MNYKKGFIVIFLLCFVFLGRSFAKDVVRLANGEWEPYLSLNLKHYGVASHIVTEAFSKVNVEVEYVWYHEAWKRAYHDAKEGKVDGTLIWKKTPERFAEMYYSDTVIFGKKDVFFHLKKRPFKWNTVKDLKGLVLGGTLGYSYGEEFDTAQKDGIFKVMRVENEVDNFRLLLRERITAFVCNLEVGKELLNKQFSPQEKAKITYHSKPLVLPTYHLLLTRKNPLNRQKIEKFNLGLSELKQNGIYDQYLADAKMGKYSRDYVPKPEMAKASAPKESIRNKTGQKELIKKQRGQLLLLEGSQGEEVEDLQKALKVKGFYNGPIDGIFSIKLTTDVKQFQKSVGISVDGIVGPITRKYLGYSY